MTSTPSAIVSSIKPDILSSTLQALYRLCPPHTQLSKSTQDLERKAASSPIIYLAVSLTHGTVTEFRSPASTSDGYQHNCFCNRIRMFIRYYSKLQSPKALTMALVYCLLYYRLHLQCLLPSIVQVSWPKAGCNLPGQSLSAIFTRSITDRIYL